ncbi:hypothetical protein M0R04_06400 [Candidatus Dojkabacteria bacterium]|jgi:hypothetical protein|nr:hypothetical protein [Candidatus Dojkabacteria bacterium]
MNKDMYCSQCKLYPDGIIEIRTQEVNLIWMGDGYEEQPTGDSFYVCGRCRYKLEDKPQ